MKIETAGAGTWLLAAVALWAACVWVLAASGLGGRIATPDPGEVALTHPLPQAGAEAGHRLDPLPQYADIRERMLFAPDRRYRPWLLDRQRVAGDSTGDFDVVLTSVLISPSLEMAIVRPRQEEGEAIAFRLGESSHQAPGWRLTALGPRSATFTGPGGERVLNLDVFDGNGGAVTAPATNDAAVVAAEAAADAAAAAAAAAASAEEAAPAAAQAEAIRRRIQARREQRREQPQGEQHLRPSPADGQ